MNRTSGSEMEKKERQCKKGQIKQEEIRQKFIIKNTISEDIKEELTRIGQLQIMKRMELNLLTGQHLEVQHLLFKEVQNTQIQN